MGTPKASDPAPREEPLLPAYESLARIIRKVVREEIAPIVRALELEKGHGDRSRAEEP